MTSDSINLQAKNEKSRVLLADDHRVVIEGIRSALAMESEFEVIGEALDGRKAIEQVRTLNPDIVVMDISMPGIGGLEATRSIHEEAPHTRVVIFTMHSEKQYVVELFKLGISAYVLKEDPMSDLIMALKVVRGGGTYFSSQAPGILVSHMSDMERCKDRKDPYLSLSGKERDVFLLLAEGRSIKAIAQALCRSPKTVESHKYSILQKLGAESIADLTRLAIRKNLIKA